MVAIHVDGGVEDAGSIGGRRGKRGALYPSVNYCLKEIQSVYVSCISTVLVVV